MLFSIIVLNCNGKQWLKNCFDSVFAQKCKGKFKYEVLLADNNSTDNSLDMTYEHYPKVRVIRFMDNYGYSKTNNSAAEEAIGKYLVFLNNDTKLDRRYLLGIYRFISIYPQAKILATQEYSYDGSKFVSWSDGIDFLGYGLSIPFPISGKVSIAPGCAFVIEKKLFDELSGFDEEMFIFHEEIDLCWRAYLIGEEVFKIKNSKFFHRTGGFLPLLSVTRRYHGELNNIRSILKNYSMPTWFLILPFYIGINVGEVAYLTLTGQFKVAVKIYFRAWFNTFKNFGDILEAHKKVQKFRKVSDWQYLKHVSWQVGKWEGFKRLRKVRFTS